MDTSDVNGRSQSPADDFPTAPPPGWLERTCFMIVGIIGSGAGGYTALERSNQLGAAFLLVIGAVFLVVGIQGTRLSGFTSGSTLVQLEQKKRIIADAIKKAQNEGNIEKASGIAEGADIAAPALGLANNVGLRYEFQVTDAIVSLGYDVMFSDLDRGFDLIVRDNRGRTIYVELKRYSRPMSRQSVQSILFQASAVQVPVLLITYTELSRAAQEAVNTVKNFYVAQWRAEDDNDQLATALRHVFASIPQSPHIGTEDQGQ
jgi:Restriction endonuclease